MRDEVQSGKFLEDANRISGACAKCVLWGHRRDLELLPQGQWLGQFGGPVPASRSGESVPPSRILRALHIAVCDRGNCEWSRFHCRDRTAACLSDLSKSAPALE